MKIVSQAKLCEVISMPIVRRPRQLTVLALSLLWTLPVFVLNLWVMHKGVLTKVFDKASLIWMGAVFLVVLLSISWLLKAKWKGFWTAVLLGVTLLAYNIVTLAATKNYALAFYALFLLILAGIYCLHIGRSLREVYYHSGQQWFEGRPGYLPKIQAEVRAGESTVPARVSRLSFEGCFAFVDPTERELGLIDGIELKLGDLSLDCAVQSVSKTKDGCGRGLRFVAGSADQEKDIKDFIDRVRSSGYVS